MQWSKIKDIVLVLLIIVNLFLFGMVVMQDWQTEKNWRETQERMLRALERNGIAFLPETIPDSMALENLQVTQTLPSFDTWAPILIGRLFRTEHSGARTVCTGTWGVVTCAVNGELEATFTDRVHAVKDGETSAQAGLAFLDSLGVDTLQTGQTSQENTETITFVQLWDGARIPAFSGSLTYEDGYLSRLNGRFLFGVSQDNPIAASLETPMDAPTALTRFLEGTQREGYICSQITEMYPGYLTAGVGNVSFTPAWFLQTDSHLFSVDAFSGELSTASLLS